MLAILVLLPWREIWEVQKNSFFFKLDNSRYVLQISCIEIHEKDP